MLDTQDEMDLDQANLLKAILLSTNIVTLINESEYF